MQFIVVHKELIQLGPIDWKQRMIQHVITDELGILFNVPISNDANEPIEVDKHTKILPVNIIYPSQFNPISELLSGPFWEIQDNVAIGTYTNTQKSLDVIKTELKALIAQSRWVQEISGTVVNIQSQDLVISTKREDRDQYNQALIQQVEKMWKINGNWITLTLDDLQIIVTAIYNHVQSAFEWEQSKSVEIDNSVDIESVLKVDLLYPGTTRIGQRKRHVREQ